MSRKSDRTVDSKNRTVTGQWNEAPAVARAAKTHQDYWRTRVKRRPFRDASGAMVEPPEYSVRMFHLGREVWFNLDTPNLSAAAIKARDIYLSLVGVGWDETLAKYKPTAATKAEVCTIGEFLADIEARSHLKPITVRRYATNLRRIVSDLANVEAGLDAKAKKAKYDYVNGGRKAWRARIESQRLDILTTDALIAWRNAYVARAGSDPIKRKSAERSAVSNLRGARSLFTKEILSVLKVKVPPNPFTNLKVKTPGPRRYRSDVNPEWLLVCAERELRTQDPQQYLALFLCLWAGLRRKEADLLMWHEVDFENGQIHVRRTRYFEPKTEESQRSIDMVPEAMDVIRGFKQGATSEFVLEGEEPYPEATYDYYRCDATWRRLHAWLREKGITEQKAIHALRKESGSLVASTFGIEAARQHLGHRDISTTSAHYVAKKRRIEVRLPIGAKDLNALPAGREAESMV